MAASDETGVALHDAEEALLETFAEESLRRAAAIEKLVADLLFFGAGRPLATDGFELLREEATATSLFGVGKLWLLEDQSTHLVWFDLQFSGTGIGPGLVGVGVRSCERANLVGERLETAVLAYPHETVAMIRWMYVFEKRPGRWQLLAAPD